MIVYKYDLTMIYLLLMLDRRFQVPRIMKYHGGGAGAPIKILLSSPSAPNFLCTHNNRRLTRNWVGALVFVM